IPQGGRGGETCDCGKKSASPALRDRRLRAFTQFPKMLESSLYETACDSARELRCREAFGVRRIPPLFVAQLARRVHYKLIRNDQSGGIRRTPNASRYSVAAWPRCAVSQICNLR